MTSIAKGKYQLEKVIASGSFGRVYADRQFAIKEMKLPTTSESKSMHSITALMTNQIRILTQLNHPNIVKVFEVIEESNAVYIVMEQCEDDLRRFTEAGPCGEKKSLEIMKQIITGYKELLRLGIVHRDLKPANILINMGEVKLADFGMAKFIANDALLLRSHVGTPYYMAPQVLQRIEYTRKCDVWSLGIIFYELLFGQLPWLGKNESALLESIMSTPLTFPSYVSPPLKEILGKMLAMSESQRIGLEELEKYFELHQQNLRGIADKSYHWTLVRKMLLIQADHRSLLLFGKTYRNLSPLSKGEVEKDLKSLLREEESYLLSFLAQWIQN